MLLNRNGFGLVHYAEVVAFQVVLGDVGHILGVAEAAKGSQESFQAVSLRLGLRWVNRSSGSLSESVQHFLEYQPQTS